MKIFSWVHRRFNNKVKKNGDVAGEDEQGENRCNDVLERWRGGGILAIGTFGYDPFKDENDDEDLIGYSSEEEEEEDDDDDTFELEDEEEDNPLVVSTTHSFNAGDHHSIAMETERVEYWSGHEEEEDDDDELELQLGFEYVMMKKQVRTTLADLFTADSQPHSTTATITKKQTPLVKQKSTHKMQGHSFGSKLIAMDPRPIHKINQVMRRMLKRKIHPDVGPANSKVAPVKSKTTTHDYVSLLPTQGALFPSFSFTIPILPFLASFLILFASALLLL